MRPRKTPRGKRAAKPAPLPAKLGSNSPSQAWSDWMALRIREHIKPRPVTELTPHM